MKKISRITILAFSVFAVILSCNKEQNIPGDDIVSSGEEQPGVINPTNPVTISVSLPEDLSTRVSFDPVINTTEGTDKGKITGMTLKWELTDKLLIADHANPSSTATFDCTSISEDGKKANFSGTFPSGTSYDISVEDGKSDSGLASISQPSNGVSNVKYWAVATDVAPEDLNDDFTLNHLSGVLALTVKMPSAADAAGVMSIDITASENIFYGGKSLTIRLNEADAENEDGILYFFASLPAANCGSIAACSLLIHLNAPGTAHTIYTRLVELGAQTFTAGKVNNININATESDTHAGKTSDDGSSAHPYLIGDPYQVAAINGLATGGATTYFKLIDDIDMKIGENSYVTHNHINTNSGYTQAVNFNGNNKTISNLSVDFFYVFKGSVYDLTLDHSTVTARGILAEYIQGSGNVINNVTVSNGTVSNSSSNVGGLVGQINSGTSGQTTATITDCVVSGTNVKGAGVVGGFVGFANELVSISGCKYTGGTVEASARYCGGFIGSPADKASVISNCQVENATVKSTCTDDARCGGFVGQLQTSVQVKGCTVGTESKKVVITTANPASGKVLNEGGFVGVNYGTITKNGSVNSKAYVQVKSENNQGQQINVGGFAGFHRGTIEYCDAVVDMSDLQGQYIGGFSGYMPTEDAKADNCTVSGSIRGNNYTGGFVGVIDKADMITNCQVLEGTVVVGQSSAGGFAAQIKSGTVEDCSAHVDLQCRGGNDGGFVGALTGGTVQRCSSAGTISQISSTNTVFGGFAGYVNGVDLIKCSSTADISVARSYVGGLVGDFQTANKVSECFYNGTISGPASTKGGLIGTTQAVAAVITNCYTAGELVGSNGTQIYGGIVGELKAGGSVTNCYSTMDMTHGGRAMGGIVGRACSGGWPVSNASGNTISKCIAWNPKITFDGTASTSASSGAIIGYTSFKNILNNCYRRSDMVYLNSNTADGTSCQTSMVDQVDCDGTNWAINGNRPAGGTPAGTSATAQYQAPYYGVAAASTATVTSIAQTLGWSSEVWDFTGALPTLK